MFEPGLKMWWRVTLAIYLVALIGVLAFWVVTHSGLYWRIAEVTMTGSGDRITYRPVVSGMVTFVVLMLPLVIVRVALGRRIRHEHPDDVMKF